MEQILAVDSGATITRAGLYGKTRELLSEGLSGPSNPSECGVEGCVSILVDLGRKVIGPEASVDCVAAGISGAFEEATRQRIAEGLCRRLPAARALICDDRWPLLVANGGQGDGVVVIAGTGSSVLAQSKEGLRLALGGRGRLVGDEGSAYRLALRALRACAHALDGLGPETALVEEVLRTADFTTFPDLNHWLLRAEKHAIARLATVVTKCAEDADPVARTCVKEEAALLAKQTLAAYARLRLADDAPLFLVGGLIEKSTIYRAAYQEALHREKSGLVAAAAPLCGHRAVLEVALAEPHAEAVTAYTPADAGIPVLAATEERSATETPIDRLSPLGIARMMNQEDARVHKAVAMHADSIAKVIERAAHAFSRGGRLIYVGAGTSGRLGVLDAAECPPTFGVPPGQVVGILAGGDKALRASIEGAEDDPEKGAADLSALDPRINEKDIVVGITASGTTPYVLGALDEAKRRGVWTVLLTCNPACGEGASLVIALNTGPEVLAGSTRLKAGTATKMVLNMISTGAMALSGHIVDGMMVGLQPLNKKLERRAVGIIGILAKVDEQRAEELLNASGGRIPVAVLMEKKGLTAEEAEREVKMGTIIGTVPINIIGLMSGTSCDGVDAALVRIEGSGTDTQIQLKDFRTFPYPSGLKARLLSPRLDAQDVCLLNFELGERLADAVIVLQGLAAEQGLRVDFVASHGHTIAHYPPSREPSTENKSCGTMQIGEAAVIAERTGLTVVSDFRPRDMAAGGQGAPLVPYADWLLFRREGRCVACLNIGGIANITVVPHDFEQVTAFDTGPGNMIIDGAVRMLSKDGMEMDQDGAAAAKGVVIPELFDQLLDHPYFAAAPPKSAGREQFGPEIYLHEALAAHEGKSSDDLIATVTAVTARTITSAIERFVKPRHFLEQLIISGGGAYNKTLMNLIREGLPGVEVCTSEDHGITSDAREAVAFAVLGNETICGHPANVLGATGASHPVILGKITPA